jgi:hypothetical protein
MADAAHDENRKRCCLTLDLEPDCGGRLASLDSLANVPRLCEMLGDIGVPVTVFVSGIIFEQCPAAVEHLARLPQIEYGVHGYSHEHGLSDHREEIRRGIESYRQYFSRTPKGYRAPRGEIHQRDLALLAEEGLMYDSSVIPTCRPGARSNLRRPNRPGLLPPYNLVELPITAFKPFSVPLGLGYMRLFGKTVMRGLMAVCPIPSTAVIYIHMHDLVLSSHTDKLSPFWRWFYRCRVAKGLGLLDRLVWTFRQRGYEFCLAGDVAEACRGQDA